ncbi:alpha-galactosidase [Stappia sp. F7233]|uniref:Alpha-galactosidase n=1 Tax=Stappia albiluteola TaxID=2758565 RepID=A0A839AAG4_9HYPH|nr:alpha-galactosidase [Stappia albiluteola]MBA5776028.1 alpha-galactosidase [Stappia albiluteola]
MASGESIRTARLDAGGTTLAVASIGGRLPMLLHFGPTLPLEEDLAALAEALLPPLTHAGMDKPVAPSIFPEAGMGFSGQPALKAHRSDGSGFETQFHLNRFETDGGSLRIEACDPVVGLSLSLAFALDDETSVLTASSTIANTGETPLSVDWLAAPALRPGPMDDRLVTWTGRWCAEFQRRISPWPHGKHLLENRTGRTSHEAFPGILSLAKDCGLDRGHALGLHLGWSGNWRLMAEETADGHRQIQAGILYLPGECVLRPGTSLSTPPVYAVSTGKGENGLASAFQRFARQNLLRHPSPDQARPVHFNSWEAVYFRHDINELKALADRAATLGAERFVLDDGWFPGRDHDSAGLGDWIVDPRKYPDGLSPLIDHVKSLGMSFGLWVEPEMVNADSDLYRSHPDWALRVEGHERLEARQQLVLDVALPDVGEYLFSRLDALLSVNDINYLKWDMNRVLTAPARDGHAVAAAQVEALYALLDRLREAHPGVEIESCASGGGRIDFGILRHAQRFWLSDNNDTHDRWPMLREALTFFPMEVFGFHVGPSPSHTTGRRLDMRFRAYSAAVGGHMGLELDLRELSDAESATLAAAIAFHKRWRALLHAGVTRRIAAADEGLCGQMTVAADGSRFLAAVVQDATIARKTTAPIRLSGLDRSGFYRLRLAEGAPVPDHSRRPYETPLAKGEGLVLSGAALMDAGFRLPLGWPDELWIIAGERLP